MEATKNETVMETQIQEDEGWTTVVSRKTKSNKKAAPAVVNNFQHSNPESKKIIRSRRDLVEQVKSERAREIELNIRVRDLTNRKSLCPKDGNNIKIELKAGLPSSLDQLDSKLKEIAKKLTRSTDFTAAEISAMWSEYKMLDSMKFKFVKEELLKAEKELEVVTKRKANLSNQIEELNRQLTQQS